MEKNTINNVILKLQYNEAITSEEDALSTAERHFYDYMFPKIQEVIDDFDVYNLNIENIELDLGKIAPEDVPYKIDTLLRKEIEKYIHINWDKLDSSKSFTSESGYTNGSWEYFDKSEYNDNSLTKTRNTYKTNTLSIETIHETTSHSSLLEKDKENKSIVNQLFDFICTEIIPWTVDACDFDPFIWWNENVDIILSQPTIVRSLFEKSRHNASVFYRVLTYSTKQTLNKISNKWLEDCSIAPKYKQETISILLEYKKELDLNYDEIDIILFVITASILFEEHELRFDDKKQTNFPSYTFSTASSTQKIALTLTRQSIIENLLVEVKQSIPSLQFIQKAFRHETIESKEFSISHINNVEPVTVTKDITTDIAGIVLLHPFLSSFFQQVGLLNEQNNFINLQCQIHAVHLVRFLSGRTGKHYSHLLHLEKVLCGLTPNFPIPLEYEITKEEEEEARNLFEAISTYWESVRNTSMRGIQNSFIQRDGTLTFEDPYWLVRVEASAIDILLENLPWGLSAVMFPWSEIDIWIDWQYDL